MKVLKGWLVAHNNDKAFLEELGVKVKGVIHSTNDSMVYATKFDVEVDEEAFKKLDKHWGRFIWGLA